MRASLRRKRKEGGKKGPKGRTGRKEKADTVLLSDQIWEKEKEKKKKRPTGNKVADEETLKGGK